MRFVFATLAAVLFSVPAFAQAPAPIWQGVYLGADLGSTNLRSEITDLVSGKTAKTSNGHSSAGAFAGYNWQFGPWVVGVEADWSRVSRNIDRDFFSFRGRGGYSFGNSLVYATVGAGTENAFLISSARGLTVEQQHTGIVAGAGLETMLMPHLALRAEALYFDAGRERYDFPAANGFAAGAANYSFHDAIYRAGISYHFN